MQSTMHSEDQKGGSKLTGQALSFFVHTLVALASWGGLMFLGYLLNPPGASQVLVLFVSVLVPLLVGSVITSFRQDEMATAVWLVGMIWLLIIALWVLDMPTGPDQCFQCGATEKLTRTFFSLPQPSGLIDNDGPFLGTWPAAALAGYSIGARLAMKKAPAPEE